MWSFKPFWTTIIEVHITPKVLWSHTVTVCTFFFNHCYSFQFSLYINECCLSPQALTLFPYILKSYPYEIYIIIFAISYSLLIKSYRKYNHRIKTTDTLDSLTLVLGLSLQKALKRQYISSFNVISILCFVLGVTQPPCFTARFLNWRKWIESQVQIWLSFSLTEVVMATLHII